MATFTAFLNTLPDPNNPIGVAGQALATASGGEAGPGFASISITSEAPIQLSRTNSGRVMTRSIAGHKWTMNIKYNPMTRDQFEPIFNFLIEKNGRLNPFYMQLPQHLASRNTAFHTHQGSNNLTTATTGSAGAGFILQAGHSTTQTTEPKPGDMFVIQDSNDSLHTKAYRVTRVMNNATYNSALHSQPTTAQRIVYFTPHLQRNVASSAVCDFGGPLIRVIQKGDVHSYSLGTNNLYEFSLNLEEAQA